MTTSVYKGTKSLLRQIANAL